MQREYHANLVYRLPDPQFYRVATLGHLLDMIFQNAQLRLNIPEFWRPHRLTPMLDALGVSRQSLYGSQAELREGSGNLYATLVVASSIQFFFLGQVI